VKQGLYLRRSQPVADGLQRRRVVDGGEGVVHRGEPDPGLGGLALRPMIAVDAQLGVVREVGAEFQEEWPEIGVNTVEVEVVDHPGGLHDPRIGHLSGPAVSGQ